MSGYDITDVVNMCLSRNPEPTSAAAAIYVILTSLKK